MKNRAVFPGAEKGRLGMIIALSDEMIAEGWAERDEDERMAEFRRRLRVALGQVREAEGQEITTTSDGQIVMMLE